jgi:hypothetical protein
MPDREKTRRLLVVAAATHFDPTATAYEQSSTGTGAVNVQEKRGRMAEAHRVWVKETCSGS